MNETQWGRLTKDELSSLTKEELLGYIDSQVEPGVRISFAGKDLARSIARRVQPRVCKIMPEYSVGSEEAQSHNLLIEGENLQAMATLYRERGQVDFILTDPPYNTGNDFRYNDKWDDDPNDPDLGEFVSEEDASRHTKWMRFMYPRLQLMKDMLKNQGVLAICIDHRELFHLGQMLDELFGEKNRLAIINWQKSYSPRSNNKHVSTATEYLLVYAKDEEKAKTGLLPRTNAMDARYGSPDGDPLPWKSGDASGPKAKLHKKMVYAIQSPFTGELIYPPQGSCWRPEQKQVLASLAGWGSEYVMKDLHDEAERAAIIGMDPKDVPKVKGLVLVDSLKKAKIEATKILETGPWPRIYFGKKGLGRPQLKNHLENVKKGIVPTTYWADDSYDSPEFLGSTSWEYQQSGHSQTGINELDSIVGKDHGFETVKPMQLFEKLIQIWCPPNGLVLDPFAGSGTTGHAVLSLNNKADASRRFIMIEQGRPENGDVYARGLTADRMKRVIEGNWANGKGSPLDGGYRFVQLQKRVDAKALLGMERDEMTDAVISSHYDNSRKGGSSLIRILAEPGKYLVARNTENEGFFLIWEGDDKSPVFDSEVYNQIVEEALEANLDPTYHVYARFNLHQSDDVKFYQIPNQILLDFGLSATTDSYNIDESKDLDD